MIASRADVHHRRFVSMALLAASAHLGCAGATSRSAPSSIHGGVPVTAIDVQPPPPDERRGEDDGAPDDPTSEPSCRCDVLGFEADGPPRGRCVSVASADGTVVWTGETSSPPFTAKLTPTARPADRAVDYVYEAELELACDAPWCGRQTRSVLRVAEGDYRVVVERSDEGPPSRVLWFTCGPR